MNFNPVNVGDVVIPTEEHPLFCGSGQYSHAICISVEPFILVSESTDMRWSQKSPTEVYPLCQAHPDIVQRCMRRLEQ